MESVQDEMKSSASYLEKLFGLEEKVAVVIGGSGVLGGRIAEGLAGAGAKVAVVYRGSRDAAEKCVESMHALGAEAMAVPADVQRREDLDNVRDAVLKRWDRVDILVNAPGVNSTTPFLEITEDEWDRVLATNLKGVFLACQVFGRVMIERGGSGSILNVTSVSSRVPLSKVFTYSISKAGLDNLTRFLAREWATHSIRVNALMPGFFPAGQNRRSLTEERRKAIFAHTPMARYGEPEELCGAAIWLASERASSFITGATIVVDGGFTAMTI